MLAFAPHSSLPIAGLPGLPGTVSPAVVYLTRTLTYATAPFTTAADDTPASTPIEGRLRPFSFQAIISTDEQGRFAGAAPFGGGNIELENGDGALDGLPDTTVSDGAVVRIKVGYRTQDEFGRPRVIPFADFGTIAVVSANHWISSTDNPSLQLRDATMRLRRPIQPDTYGGTGGLAGSEELSGLTKPICYGVCRNISPVLMDPVALVYQFNDQPSLAVDSVRDKGKRLDPTDDYATLDELLDVEVERGSFATCLAEGCFRLGDTPAGAVTADVRGSKSARAINFFSDGTSFTDGTGFITELASTYVDSTAPIIARLMTDRGIVRPEEVETTSFGILERDQPAIIGFYSPAGSGDVLLDVVDRLAKGVGAFFGPSNDGRFAIQRFEAPAGSRARTLGAPTPGGSRRT